MKKKITILSAIFLAFLALGIWLHTQRGVYYNDEFWRKAGEGEYSAANGDRIKYLKNSDGVDYDLTLEGKEITAQALYERGKTRIKFSDGWTAVLYNDSELRGDAFFNKDEIILDDMDKMGLKFSYVTEATYGNDQNDMDIEEVLDYPLIESENVITLKNGSIFKTDGYSSNEAVYQNERGEYLMNPSKLYTVNAAGSQKVRVWFADFLIELTSMPNVRRGEVYVLFLYVFIFAVGALTFLFPQKMAFIFNRWRYKNEPELSETGVEVEVFSGVAMMALSVFLVFMPLFIG